MSVRFFVGLFANECFAIPEQISLILNHTDRNLIHNGLVFGRNWGPGQIFARGFSPWDLFGDGRAGAISW